MQIGAGASWDNVAGGDHHTCARRTDGTMWCWGWNVSDQLGDGTIDSNQRPQRVRLS